MSKTYIEASMAVTKAVLDDNVFLSELQVIQKLLVEAYAQGNKMLIAGNGGSAADAQHFAAEITARYRHERKARPAIALHTDTSALTAWSNDYTFDTAYARLVEAYGIAGDVLVVISTSGNSKNLMNAAKAAREQGVRVVGLLGKGGGMLVREGLCDHALVVPSEITPHIQECHGMLIHIFCEALDESFAQADIKK